MQDPRLQFEGLSLPLKSEVYRLARALTGNDPDALDLVQETYLKAWQSYGGYREDQRFRPWLFTILRRAHVDACRRRRVRPATSAGHAEPEAPPAPADLSDEIQAALDRLKPAHHWLLLLRDVQGFTYAEIAGILEWPEGSVMSGLHHARAALRRRLKA